MQKHSNQIRKTSAVCTFSAFFPDLKITSELSFCIIIADINFCCLLFIAKQQLPFAVIWNKVQFYKYRADKSSVSLIWSHPIRREVQLHCPLPVGHQDLNSPLCKMPDRTARSNIGIFFCCCFSTWEDEGTK